MIADNLQQLGMDSESKISLRSSKISVGMSDSPGAVVILPVRLFFPVHVLISLHFSVGLIMELRRDGGE